MFEDSSDEEMLAWLEEEGALNWVGMDDDGERVLTMNPERMKEIFPELYQVMMQELSDTLMELAELGYVNVYMNEDGEEGFQISEEGRKIIEKYGYNIDPERGIDLND